MLAQSCIEGKFGYPLALDTSTGYDPQFNVRGLSSANRSPLGKAVAARDAGHPLTLQIL